MAYRSVGTGVSGNGTTASPAVPSGLQVDDIVVVGLYIHNSTETPATIPTGFTLKVNNNTNGATRGELLTYWKRITVAGDTTDEPDGDYDFTWTTGADYEAVALAFSGRVRVGDPFDATANASSSNSTVLSISDSLTTIFDHDDMVVFTSAHSSNLNTWSTSSTGYTERFDAADGTSAHHLGAFTRDDVSTAGSVTLAASFAGNTGNSLPKINSLALAPDFVVGRARASAAPASASTEFTATLPTHVGPNGDAVGDRLLVKFVIKPDTAADPTVTTGSGWTLVKSITGGTGSVGADTGPVKVVVFAKDATSSSETNPGITPGASTSSWAYESTAWACPRGKVWRDAIGSNVDWVQSGADTTTGSAIFAATASDWPGMPTVYDAIEVAAGMPSDTVAGFNGAATMTATGLSGGKITQGSYRDNSLGNDCAFANLDWRGFSGTASAGVALSQNFISGTATGVMAAIALRQAVGGTNVTGGQATETDAASAGTVQIGVHVTGGRASETDAARAGTINQAITGGRATETDTARAGAINQAITGGRASETDTARAGQTNVSYQGTRASETDAARAGTAVNATVVAGGQATETDAARAGTVTVATAYQGTRATETDTARTGSGTVGVVVNGGRATETETARAGTVTVTTVVNGGRATETDTARAGTAQTGVHVTGGRATETDVARVGSVFLPGIGDVVTLAQASETDTAGVVTIAAAVASTVTLAQASETDTAYWITEYVVGAAGDLTVFIIDDELEDTPANILVDVGNGNDGETVDFSIFGPSGFYSLLSTELDDEDGIIQVQLELPELDAGTYVLTVTGTVSGTATATFVVLVEPLDDTPDTEDATEIEEPTWTTDPAQHWQLIDTTIGDENSYTFPHNPAKWTNPTRPNFLEHEVTTAPDGNILAWQSAERSWTFEFSGYLDTQEQYEALQFWAELRRRFWLIDHRDKAHYITFEQLDVRARIVPNKPWAHDYTVRAIHFYARPD